MLGIYLEKMSLFFSIINRPIIFAYKKLKTNNIYTKNIIIMVIKVVKYKSSEKVINNLILKKFNCSLFVKFPCDIIFILIMISFC